MSIYIYTCTNKLRIILLLFLRVKEGCPLPPASHETCQFIYFLWCLPGRKRYVAALLIGGICQFYFVTVLTKRENGMQRLLQIWMFAAYEGRKCMGCSGFHESNWCHSRIQIMIPPLKAVIMKMSCPNMTLVQKTTLLLKLVLREWCDNVCMVRSFWV